jgi:hypothetical protein
MTEAIWTEAFYRIADKLTDAANAAEKKPIAEALLPIILEGGKLIISLQKMCPKATTDLRQVIDYATQAANQDGTCVASTGTVVAEMRSIAAALRGQRARFVEFRKDTEDRRKVESKRTANPTAGQGGTPAKKAGGGFQGHKGKVADALRGEYGRSGITGCWLCAKNGNGKAERHAVQYCPDMEKALKKLDKAGVL